MKKLFIFFVIICSSYALESFSGLLDNDMFLSDKWYTNGLEFEYSDYYFDKEENGEKNNGRKIYILGQKLYTPTKFYKSNIEDFDRPFAGYLYFGQLNEKWFEDGKFRKKGWLLETIGDASLGAVTQKLYHKWFFLREPKGWHSEIENIYGLAFVMEDSPVYKRWKLSKNIDTDVRMTTNLHLGNVMLYGGTLGTWRVGNFNSAYEFTQKKDVQKKFTSMDEYYLKVTTGLNLIGHNSTLEGNIFENGSVFTKNVYPLVLSSSIGFFARWDDFSFTYDLTMISTEIKEMTWDNNWQRYSTLKFQWFY